MITADVFNINVYILTYFFNMIFDVIFIIIYDVLIIRYTVLHQKQAC
jgi:hypothetical protein